VSLPPAAHDRWPTAHPHLLGDVVPEALRFTRKWLERTAREVRGLTRLVGWPDRLVDLRRAAECRFWGASFDVTGTKGVPDPSSESECSPTSPGEEQMETANDLDDPQEP
jgi:hypothetical protein